jgi:hypothetical protein
VEKFTKGCSNKAALFVSSYVNRTISSSLMQALVYYISLRLSITFIAPFPILYGVCDGFLLSYIMLLAIAGK